MGRFPFNNGMDSFDLRNKSRLHVAVATHETNSTLRHLIASRTRGRVPDHIWVKQNL